MKNIIVFGYGYIGCQIYKKLEKTNKYHMMGFADNSPLKQGYIAFDYPIRSLSQLKELQNNVEFSVVIASNAWVEIGKQLEEIGIAIEGICINEEIEPYQPMSFDKIDFLKPVYLYAGDICDEIHMSNPYLYGLSINKCDNKHILHDITQKYPLLDECIDNYQAEDVLEHIELKYMKETINEIYRILKVGGIFRICLPDYYSPYLKRVSMKEQEGNIIFDPTGGGILTKEGVKQGGHVWFPTYKKMEEILSSSSFREIKFLCYHTEDERLIRKEIDFSKGYIRRIPMNDSDMIYSMVIDCYK